MLHEENTFEVNEQIEILSRETETIHTHTPQNKNKQTKKIQLETLRLKNIISEKFLKTH